MFIGDMRLADFWIIILLLRYEFYQDELQGTCLSVNIVYDFIKSNNFEDTTLEAFAGSLNSNLKNYCSLFYDIERYFGSKGSFFKQKPELCIYKIVVANPPYVTGVLDSTANMLIEFMDKCNDITVILTIPDWRSKKEFDNDKNFNISINEKIHERTDELYKSYETVRRSKYFRTVITVGSYQFYDYFHDIKRGIRSNVLFVLLSTVEPEKNVFINKIKSYVKTVYKKN
jgi:hypothetical protein